MTKIIIEYESEDFFRIMINKLDKILDSFHLNHIKPKITIDFRNENQE